MLPAQFRLMLSNCRTRSRWTDVDKAAAAKRVANHRITSDMPHCQGQGQGETTSLPRELQQLKTWLRFDISFGIGIGNGFDCQLPRCLHRADTRYIFSCALTSEIQWGV